jgi:sugar phosphate isomerase/epimerase
MKLGFLTVALGPMPLEAKAEWAAAEGFQALELACWPRRNDRDYSASDLDVATLTQAEADRVRARLDGLGLAVSSLAYYDNNLDRDPAKRAAVNVHVRKTIDAAAMLGVERVGTFVGRNIDRSIEDNFGEFEEVFGGLVAYAGARGVRLMIENCPMTGWQKPGEPGTISFSPELWAEMFRRIPDASFGLNLDPSHLVYQRIDVLPLIPLFRDRIFHVHAKDMRVFEDRFAWYGIFNRQLGVKEWSPLESGFERARMPGLGLVDWEAFLMRLHDNGFDGFVSIEHEDPDYAGSEARIKEGLSLGRAHLIEVGGRFFAA